MNISLSKKEIEQIESRLSLRFDRHGIEYNGMFIAWAEVEEIKEMATREEMPINRCICAKVVQGL